MGSGNYLKVCTLYGATFVFSMLVEVRCASPLVVLNMTSLDDFIHPQGHADSLDVWRVIVSRMLQAEGL
jgi:hypothetical protein